MFIQDFINSKLGLEIEIDSAWGKNKVIVAKIKREGKSEIMNNKNKLAGSQVFIENDLSI